MRIICCNTMITNITCTIITLVFLSYYFLLSFLFYLFSTSFSFLLPSVGSCRFPHYLDTCKPLSGRCLRLKVIRQWKRRIKVIQFMCSCLYPAFLRTWFTFLILQLPSILLLLLCSCARILFLLHLLFLFPSVFFLLSQCSRHER